MSTNVEKPKKSLFTVKKETTSEKKPKPEKAVKGKSKRNAASQREGGGGSLYVRVVETGPGALCGQENGRRSKRMSPFL